MCMLVGILMVLIGSMEDMCRSEEFGRKNIIRVLSGEEIICVKYMV